MRQEIKIYAYDGSRRMNVVNWRKCGDGGLYKKLNNHELWLVRNRVKSFKLW